MNVGNADVNMSDIIKNIESVSEDIINNITESMVEFGQEIESQSTAIVPRKTGELASRSFTTKPYIDNKDIVVSIGYEKYGGITGIINSESQGKLYAIPVHERTNINHPNGQAKFLETPFKQMSGQFLRYLADGVDL